MTSFSCPNRHSPPSVKGGVGAIIRHGSYHTGLGKLPASGLWEDILLDKRETLLSTPTPAGHF
jgi:hypothetical protein